MVSRVKFGFYLHQIVREESNDLHRVSLNDLHPATAYNITVHCRPTSGHYWSDTVSIQGITDEDGTSGVTDVLLGLDCRSSCLAED